MVILIRIFLVSLIIYLIIRAFSQYGGAKEEYRHEDDSGKGNSSRKISRKTGEYIDFEEQKK
jgi:hypothetical protein